MPGNGIRAVRGPQKGGIYMAQIRVKDLTFCYDGGIDNIFEDVSFSIDTDWDSSEGTERERPRF